MLTLVMPLVSLASFVAASAVVVIVPVVAVCVAMSLGGNTVDVVVFAVFNVVITAFTAAMFALSVFSRHFFLLLRLPCPGPGMLSRETEKKTKKKRKTEGLVLGSETGSVVLYSWFCGSVVL